MKTKTEQVRELYHNGDIKGALRIVKTFRIGFSKDQRVALQRGYEAMVHERTYVQMYDEELVEKIKKDATNILVDYLRGTIL